MKLSYILSLIFSLTIAGASAQQTSKPFVLGEIRELKSVQLSETRILNIYLPEGYNAKDTTRYPVIYLLDGSASEDFIHVAGLVQFGNFPWVHLLPKSILVGIANVDRKRDFTYPTTIAKDKKEMPTTGSSAKFIAFLETELQPFIQKEYKTNSVKTLIGESLGGLLATEVLFKKPQLFNHYIIVSPSLWWDHESLLGLKLPEFKTPASVFIAVGKEGDIMENDARKLTSLLQAAQQLKVSFEYFPAENHGTIFHLAVYSAFKALN